MDDLRQFIAEECKMFPEYLPIPVENYNDTLSLVEIAYKAFHTDQPIEKQFFIDGFKQSERHQDLSLNIIDEVSSHYCEKANDYKEVMRIMKDNNLSI